MTDTVNKQALLDWLDDEIKAHDGEGADRDVRWAYGRVRAALRRGAFDTPSTPVQGYREALEWYADKGNHEKRAFRGIPKPSKIELDGGERARQALSQTDIQHSGEERVRNMYRSWRSNFSPIDTFPLETVLDVIDTVANIFGVSGINSTEYDQPGPKRHATKRYAIKLGNEYLRERFGDDCFTDDLGHAFLFFYQQQAEHWRRGTEYVVAIEVDEEGGLYDPSTEEEETDA